jgi:3-methyladenine DNA glycosylase/8-oxoguanine DNA glycosylase
MSTGEKHVQEIASSKTYALINRSIKALNVAEMEMEQEIAAPTPAERIQKLVKVYTAIKPLLAVISSLPLLPQAWRAAVSLFVAAVEAVVSSPELNPDFKAGKDL